MSGNIEKASSFAGNEAMEEEMEMEEEMTEVEDIFEDLSPLDKLFLNVDHTELIKVFKECDKDKSRSLDIEELVQLIHHFDKTIPSDSIQHLHAKIDVNSDNSVSLSEFSNFLTKNMMNQLDLKTKNNLFRSNSELLPVDSQRLIVKMFCKPLQDVSLSDLKKYCLSKQIRPYQNCQYVFVSTGGQLVISTNDFKKTKTVCLANKEEKIPRFHHKKHMYVNDVVYIKHLNELVVSTSDREVLFYDWDVSQPNVKLKYCLQDEDITAMDCWSSEEKAILALGTKGFLYVITSTIAQRNSLLNQTMFDKTSLKNYSTFSSLLKTVKKDFFCVKIDTFDCVCSHIRYIPDLNSYAVCSRTSEVMILTKFTYESKTHKSSVSNKVFKSIEKHKFFTCVEYSRLSNFLITGGVQGILQVWSPHKPEKPQYNLVGHIASITHIFFNPLESLFVTISADRNVRIWADGYLECLQSFFAENIKSDLVTSVCYNLFNNELFVANTNIAKCFGRGTDVFHNVLTSHDMPLCDVMYHSIFKQVVSVCQNGEVVVWNFLNGKVEVQFKVISENVPAKNVFMSFDSDKRRLITIAQDRKVKTWNFNIGTKLSEYEVNITNVSGLVCCDNNIFISSSDSNKILALDFKDTERKYLTHPQLSDICFMEIHEERLIAISSEGIVITWYLGDLEAEYYINSRENPEAYLVSQLYKMVPEALEKSQRQPTVEKTRPSPKLLTLKSREVTCETAALLILEDNCISAWSVSVNGGLIGKFKLLENDDATITCMSTNKTDTILLAGDSNGQVYLWDIQEFGLKTDNGPFEKVKGRNVSLRSPPLLKSWQASYSALVSVVCDPSCEKIITASKDHNVTLWTHTGSGIGIFRKHKWTPKSQPTQKILMPKQ